GDFVVPRVNHQEFLQTPPLHYWVLGFWLRIAGVEPDGLARMPSVAASVGTLLLTVLLARRHVGERAAFLSGAVLATMIGFWDTGHRVIVDTSLTFFTTLCLVQLARIELDGDLSLRRGALLGAAAGLAFLTKGFVGPVIVGIVALVTLLRRPALRTPGAIRPAAAACAAFLLVALPWVIALVRRDPGFATELLFAHVKRRALEGSSHNPSNFTFIHRSLLMLLPAAALLPILVAAAIRGRRGGTPAPSRSRRLNGLLLAWIAVPVILLLVSRSKRNLYLLPVFPAVAVLLGTWLDGVLERFRHRPRLPRVFETAAWSLLVIVPVAGTLYRVAEGPERSLRGIGSVLARLEAEGSPVVGYLLEEREQGAIAWYLRHPFEEIDDAAALKDRLAGRDGAVALVGDADALAAAAAGGADIARARVVFEKKLRRRRLEVLQVSHGEED
ncbi:MAG TPA: glycosyltransferase family 39 protein, partial [Planctomycetota bacterium]|nr:glycosyltransferase family 39 protein [Planctomycetota bacterium]